MLALIQSASPHRVVFSRLGKVTVSKKDEFVMSKASAAGAPKALVIGHALHHAPDTKKRIAKNFSFIRGSAEILFLDDGALSAKARGTNNVHRSRT